MPNNPHFWVNLSEILASWLALQVAQNELDVRASRIDGLITWRLNIEEK